MQSKLANLREAVQADGIRITGPPTYARYDPPWTLPFLRRNEVLIEIPPDAS